MKTYGIAKRIRYKHLPYLHQPPRWGRAGRQIGFSHFRHHNVTPSHCSIHYVLPWEWGEVHAENQGRKWPPARRGKMASVIILAPPPGGIGLNIDMQHYKTRLLSGCRVTASRLSPLWHTHIHPDKHTCTRTSTYYKICVQHLDSVAYCDDCSSSGDWETFTDSIVAVSLFSLCVIVFVIFFLASLFTEN